MTSADFKTRKQDLVADLNRLKALRFGDSEVIKSLGVIVKSLEDEISALKSTIRAFQHAAKQHRCGCSCRVECERCKALRKAEVMAA